MSHVFTKEFFRQEYLHRVAEGELLPKGADSTAISMLIQEINKPRQKDCDFGNYSFYDVCWLDFRADIFSSDEVLDISDTGFQSRMIDEQSCYQCLKSFVGQIKNIEIKIAILKFFMTDDFKREVLEINYVAYRDSSEMIQEQCAIVLGEVNRAIHGSIAPDLANLPDDYGELEEEKSEKPKNGNKQIIDYNGQTHIMEVYQQPSEEENAQSYTQLPRLPYCTYIVPNAPNIINSGIETFVANNHSFDENTDKQNKKTFFEYINVEDETIAQMIEEEFLEVVYQNTPAKVVDIFVTRESQLKFTKNNPQGKYDDLQKYFQKLGFKKCAFVKAWKRKFK